MSRALDRIVQEAREDLGKEELRRVDWDALDRRVFDRIDRERRAELAPRAARDAWLWGSGAIGFAVAVVGAIVVGKGHEERALDAALPKIDDRAGTVQAIDGAGDVLVDGKAAAVGATLHLGEVVDARGAQATVERAGKVRFIIERGTRTTFERGQGALVLALDRGAVEAQVVPVERGEAFAVDLGHSRVAVHGTHLRVARLGERVFVDLNEGVISVGEAPRVGSTSGTLVVAPAHLEFIVNDTVRTLTVSHDVRAVRTPVALALGPVIPGLALASTIGVVSVARGESDARTGVVPSVSPAHAEPRASSAFPAPTASVADPNAEVTLAAAVRACLAERPSAQNVTISVSTTLHLALHDDGTVRSARFDPPVAPDVNGCAAPAIYRTRFAHTGDIAIPVDFRVPSSAP